MLSIDHGAGGEASLDEREVGDRFDVLGRGAAGRRGPAGRDRSGIGLQVGLAGDHPQQAADGSSAVKAALGSAKDFHAIDVDQLQVGVGVVVADADIVDIEADGRLGVARERAVRQAADDELVAAWSQVGHGQSGRLAREVADAAGPGLGQVGAGDGAHRQGQAVGQGRAPRRGHHDLGDGLVSRFGPGSRGCRQGVCVRRGGGGAGKGPRRRQTDDADGAHIHHPVATARPRQQPLEALGDGVVSRDRIAQRPAGRGGVEADGDVGLDREVEQRRRQGFGGQFEAMARRRVGAGGERHKSRESTEKHTLSRCHNAPMPPRANLAGGA